MTIKIFNNPDWNIVQRLKVFRTSTINDWVRANKISSWRGNDSTGFWDIVYPDLPVSLSTPSISGSGAVGTQFDVSTLFIWDYSDYRIPTSVTYQWQRSTSTSGPWTNRGSLLSSYGLYTIQSDDVGFFFRLQITGTNAKGSTVVNSSSSLQANDPSYTFAFLNRFGVNANAQIWLDPANDSSFPDSSFAFTSNRGLNYFFGDYKHFRIWYKSDSTTFRLYHQMYRNDRTTRPATPDIEYEIVFTNNSNIVDVHVVNAIATSYIESYAAYIRGFTLYKSYNSANYVAGQRFRVTLDASTPISVASVPASTTSPSSTDGWIFIGEDIDSSVGTVEFGTGFGLPSPTNRLDFFGPFNAFNKSNMFYPRQVNNINAFYSNSTQATVSWSYSAFNALNGNSFIVQVMSSDNSTVLSTSAATTSSSTTISSLTAGTTYNIRVYSNSRSDGLGQTNIPLSISYTHATVPNAPTGVSGTAGNAQVSLTWTAPSNNGSNITGYRVRHSSNGGSTWSSPISTGSTSTSYTVTGLTNGTSYIFQVLAINAIGDGPWSASSSSVTPNVTATKIAVSASDTSISTFGTSTITAQLQDASNNNVALSGRTITFSLDASPAGSLSGTSAVTNSNGAASVTYTGGSSAGLDTITAASTGLTSGSVDVTVLLRSALNPTLVWTPQNYGGSVAHNNYDSSYTYTGSISNGSLRTGQSYASTAFTVDVPVQNGAEAPAMSGDNTNGTGFAGTVTCTISNVWVINPPATVTVNTTRSGYFAGKTVLSDVQGSRTRTGLVYAVVNIANGNIIHTSASTTATTYSWQYPGADVGKTVRWRVTATFNDGSTSTRESGTRTLG
jgi:hypothetical protein